MCQWLEHPELLTADKNARYVAEIEIDLDELDEPVLCCPNDPDDARRLSSVDAVEVDEVFLGSCMTTAQHFTEAGQALTEKKQVPVKFWVAPPTRMAEQELSGNGTYATLKEVGARLEMPGCSLCMGNQARVADGAVVVSTSTRNFPNRMGNGAQVYLSSARVAGLAAKLGRLPTVHEYRDVYAELCCRDNCISDRPPRQHKTVAKRFAPPPACHTACRPSGTDDALVANVLVMRPTRGIVVGSPISSHVLANFLSSNLAEPVFTKTLGGRILYPGCHGRGPYVYINANWSPLIGRGCQRRRGGTATV